MPSERVSTDLCRVAVTPVAGVTVRPVFEKDMTEFVGKRAALPHRVPGTCDTDEYGPAGRISHGQAMLIRADIKHSNIDPSSLFDDRYEITQWLHSEMMITTEPCSRRPAFRLGSQRSTPRKTIAGMAWPDR